jgi:hypothetical protein
LTCDYAVKSRRFFLLLQSCQQQLQQQQQHETCQLIPTSTTTQVPLLPQNKAHNHARARSQPSTLSLVQPMQQQTRAFEFTTGGGGEGGAAGDSRTLRFDVTEVSCDDTNRNAREGRSVSARNSCAARAARSTDSSSVTDTFGRELWRRQGGSRAHRQQGLACR